MTENRKTPDLFELTQAPMRDLVEDLKREATLADEQGAAPPRALQVAGLALSESIRLIRMGTRSEIAAASDELSQLLITAAGERLKQERPGAYRLLSGASVALGAATPASSKGGAQTVLRSWNGKAKEVMKLIFDAPQQEAERAHLRKRVGIAEESHFSHILADLEAARLIVRVKIGKTTLVRLGPAGDDEKLREEFSDGRRIFPEGLYEPRIEAGDRTAQRNDLRPRPLRLLPAEQTGLAPVAENDVFTSPREASTSTLCLAEGTNKLATEFGEPFAEAMSAADSPVLTRQTQTN